MAAKVVEAAQSVEVAAPLVELPALRMRMKALKVTIVGALTVGRIMKTTALKMRTRMTVLILGLVEALVMGLLLGVGVGAGEAGKWVAAGKVGIGVKITVVCAAFRADMVVKVMVVEGYAMVVVAVQVVVLLADSASLRKRA
jgi:hypothetical protein